MIVNAATDNGLHFKFDSYRMSLFILELKNE